LKITNVETEYNYESNVNPGPRILLDMQAYTVSGKKYASVRTYVHSVREAIKSSQSFFGKINADLLDQLNYVTQHNIKEAVVEVKATNPLMA
jgi:hypothetical protein